MNKAILRIKLLQAMQTLPAEIKAAADRAILEKAKLVLTKFRPGPIALYMPMTGEADTLALAQALQQEGRVTALPVVVEEDAPLIFRVYKNEATLLRGPFGVAVPPDNSPEVVPSTMIVPMLGFNRDGYRLGRGGGYYDRTLAHLRGQHGTHTIGLAYACQEIDFVPEAHDERLDCIITEKEIIHCL